MLGKQCNKCNEFKVLECFSESKNKKNRKQSQCKECNEKYREKHKKEIVKYQKKYREGNKEKRSQYSRKWYQKNKEKIREKRNQYIRIRYITNPLFRLNELMSRAIRRVKNPSIKKQGRSWKALVPYTLIELKKHLKGTLPKGYTWKDFMQGKLHIDHILPIAIFKYEKPEDLDFQICWELDNLRLLPSGENRRKHTKLVIPFQKNFSIEVNIKKYKEVI